MSSKLAHTRGGARITLRPSAFNLYSVYSHEQAIAKRSYSQVR